jgi:Lactoylglutathione lyase and related lyases
MRAEDWLAYLREHEIEVDEGPVARTGATGPLMSVYVRDPDGNLIELAWQM